MTNLQNAMYENIIPPARVHEMFTANQYFIEFLQKYPEVRTSAENQMFTEIDAQYATYSTFETLYTYSRISYIRGCTILIILLYLIRKFKISA
jgi:hypothetical protein